jgi:hypothetical protein
VTKSRVYEYHYRDAINGFFELPTEVARALLPGGHQPIEVHHGQSVLAVTAFEFHDSAVGAYREIALSILVAPRIMAGEAMPRAAMYPFLVGTTTPEARRHGMDVWHLPHHPRNLEVEITRGKHDITVAASEHGHILDLTITHPAGVPWQTVEHHYQTFSQDDEGAYMSPLLMTGPFMENEEERGCLRLSPHAFTSGLDLDEITTTPFREQWMKDGVESIHPLQRLAALAGR